MAPDYLVRFFIVGYLPSGDGVVLGQAVSPAEAECLLTRMSSCDSYERIEIEPARDGVRFAVLEGRIS